MNVNYQFNKINIHFGYKKLLKISDMYQINDFRRKKLENEKAIIEPSQKHDR